MGRWLQLRDRYLHLLLEMQGITRDPICSMCTNTMEIKCDDCFGANYFCRSCCLDAHQRSPYHWTLHWTGNHFVPISLHELGFILYLGHHGTPCPNTYEVCSCHTVHPPLNVLIHFQGAQLLQMQSGKQKKGKVSKPKPLVDLQASCNSSEDVYDFVKPSIDYAQETLRRKHTASSGNPLLAVVNTTSISEIEIVHCICPDAMLRHEQLLQAGLLPSSFEEPETAFTFSVLDDFLAHNLECKTTAQQYYSTLQNITNKMFPYCVPVCDTPICIFTYIGAVFSAAHMAEKILFHHRSSGEDCSNQNVAHMLIMIYRIYIDIY